MGHNYSVSSNTIGVSASGNVPTFVEVGGPSTSSFPVSPSLMDRGGEDANRSEDFGTPSGLLASSSLSTPLSSAVPSSSIMPSDHAGPSDSTALSDSTKPSDSAPPPFWSKIGDGNLSNFYSRVMLILSSTLGGSWLMATHWGVMLLPRTRHTFVPRREEELILSRPVVEWRQAQPMLKYPSPYTSKVDASLLQY